MPWWAVAGAIGAVVAAAVVVIGGAMLAGIGRAMDECGAMLAGIGRAMDECGPSPSQDREPRG